MDRYLARIHSGSSIVIEVTQEQCEAALRRGLAYMLGEQRSDGGWARTPEALSDAWTTAEGVLAVLASGSDIKELGLANGVQWLVEHQLDDGSWSSDAYRQWTDGAGDVAGTSYALQALCSYTNQFAESDIVRRGLDWLIQRQRSDGGWGIHRATESRSHVGLTAYAIRAIAYCPTDHVVAESLQSALYYLDAARCNQIGWRLAPSQLIDFTLTCYALRAIIDAYALKRHRPRPELFISWLRAIKAGQHEDGSWSDWYGSESSIEATSYNLEIAGSVAPLTISKIREEEWLKRALRFLLATQTEVGGWPRIPNADATVWVSYSALVALARLLGVAGRVSLGLSQDVFPNVWDHKRWEVAVESDRYDFAMSFAGADREYAHALALRLQHLGASVFFDEFETSALWGSNLIDTLTDIYREKAEFCVMLISTAYVAGAWPNLERQSAQAKALKEKGDYILPIVLGDTIKVPGLLETIGYLKASQYDLETIASLALEKLARSRRRRSSA